MSDIQIIRNTAPTLAGFKTGSLFTCSYESKSQITDEIRSFNKAYAKKGLSMVPLRYSAGKVLIYLFRPEMLRKDLSDPECTDLLLCAGYSRLRGIQLGQLARRLQNSPEFPHEIGLFLGYPAEDVVGFIENKGKNYKLSGLWKVYGDREAAERKFSEYKACISSWCRQYSSGVSLDDLVAAV